MDAITTILSRTSYRGKYTDEIVPREDLQTILKAGLAAPSGCNKQTTSLLAIDSPNMMKQIWEAMGNGVGASAPAMICVFTRGIIAYDGRSFHVQDYSAAIQNMLLAIVALGYESCWVEGHITGTNSANGKRMADVLGVPEEYELVCYLPIGKAEEPLRHVKKEAFENRTWFNGFGLN